MDGSMEMALAELCTQQVAPYQIPCPHVVIAHGSIQSFSNSRLHYLSSAIAFLVNSEMQSEIIVHI
jgi:hypothetical protein